MVTTYTYDAANRLTAVGNVSYTYDNRGNLTHDGVFTYTWNAAGRLVRAESITHTVVYTYNGDDVRVASAADGTETRYVQDVVGLPQVLVETAGGQATLYVYGVMRLAQVRGGDAEWFLGDALGSVRQLVDDDGGVVLTRDYDPYGQMVSADGTGRSGYGFTGEQYDRYIDMLFLRARWYSFQTGRFSSQDLWEGSVRQPQTFHKYVYVLNNPTDLTDRGGLAPIVDCTAWPTYLGLKGLCQQANGPDHDPSVLDAREKIFETFAAGGLVKSLIGGGAGYVWAAATLSWFLNGNGNEFRVNHAERPVQLLPGVSASLRSFAEDPGIRRATKQYLPPTDAGEEPAFIYPLLWVFLDKYVQPASKNGSTSVGAQLVGAEYYSNGQPRPLDTGFWAAFGHVSIDGAFSAQGRESCRLGGYVVSYQAEYYFSDRYHWTERKLTPFDLPARITSPRGQLVRVEIPHEWEISLTKAAPPRAQEYPMFISWTEKERILVGPDFKWYRVLAWWEVGL